MTMPNTASEATWADYRSLRPDELAASPGKPLAMVSRWSRCTEALGRYLAVDEHAGAAAMLVSAAICAALTREERDALGTWRATTADIVVGLEAAADGTNPLESSGSGFGSGHIR